MSKSYSNGDTGWLCEDCNNNEIDEYGCQFHMECNEPVCTDCCHCPEHDECEQGECPNPPINTLGADPDDFEIEVIIRATVKASNLIMAERKYQEGDYTVMEHNYELYDLDGNPYISSPPNI